MDSVHLLRLPIQGNNLHSTTWYSMEYKVHHHSVQYIKLKRKINNWNADNVRIYRKVHSQFAMWLSRYDHDSLTEA